MPMILIGGSVSRPRSVSTMHKRRHLYIGHHLVGLDMGTHAVKGVEMIDHDSELAVRSAGSVDPAAPSVEIDSPQFVHAVRTLWSTAGFETTRVAMSLPPENVYLKWLQLEAGDEDELDEIARSAATRGAPFAPSDAIVDYRVLSSRQAGKRTLYSLMLVAASSEAVDRALNVAQKAGLELVAVDVGIVAVSRGLSTQKGHANPLWTGQPRSHCVLGAKNTLVSVVRGGVLEFSRVVPFGGNDFTQLLAQTLSIETAAAERLKTDPGTRLEDGGVLIASHNTDEVRVPCEALMARLAREIQRSLRFFSSQYAEGSYLGTIGTVTLSGGGASLRGIDTCLTSFGVDVSDIINPFAGYPVEAGGAGIRRVRDDAAAYTTAVGLAVGVYDQTVDNAASVAA
jgi:type IV pilus assembly protein PilM